MNRLKQLLKNTTIYNLHINSTILALTALSEFSNKCIKYLQSKSQRTILADCNPELKIAYMDFPEGKHIEVKHLEPIKTDNSKYYDKMFQDLKIKANPNNYSYESLRLARDAHLETLSNIKNSPEEYDQSICNDINNSFSDPYASAAENVQKSLQPSAAELQNLIDIAVKYSEDISLLDQQENETFEKFKAKCNDCNHISSLKEKASLKTQTCPIIIGRYEPTYDDLDLDLENEIDDDWDKIKSSDIDPQLSLFANKI